MSAGTVGVSITAGTIAATGNTGLAGHQIKMGHGELFIHIDAETARQWVDVLITIATITAEENNA